MLSSWSSQCGFQHCSQSTTGISSLIKKTIPYPRRTRGFLVNHKQGSVLIYLLYTRSKTKSINKTLYCYRALYTYSLSIYCNEKYEIHKPFHPTIIKDVKLSFFHKLNHILIWLSGFSRYLHITYRVILWQQQTKHFSSS